MNKFCKKCNQELPLESFHKSKIHKLGVCSWCKECKAEADKKRDRSDRIRKQVPEQIVAKNYINNSIASGKLIRPNKCFKCEKSSKYIHAHHPNYEFPEKIIWLCASCHRRVHL